MQRFLRGTKDEDGLIDAIRYVAPDNIELEDDEINESGFVHLYLYSPNQRAALTRAVKRHLGAGEEFEALRTLLGLRGEIQQQAVDQEMVSVLQEEFVARHLLRFLGFGIVQTVEQFERPNPDIPNGPPAYRNWGTNRRFNWDHPVEDEIEGMSFPLNVFFSEHLFESAVQYDPTSSNPIKLDSSLERIAIGEDYGGQYPFSHRHTGGIPLEYIWGAFDALTPDWVNSDDPEVAERLTQLIRRFRWTGDGDGRRITPAHLKALAEKMAEATEHIEASIPEWHKSAGTPKQPLPLAQLLTQSFDETELAFTAREYLDLEHGAKERQLRRELRQSVPYRATEGNSVLFRCTTPPDPDDETYTIEGDMWIPGGGAGAANTESGISEGDWVVMTPIDETQDPPTELGIQRASDIARMPLVHVVEIDNGEITVAAPWNDWSWPSYDHDFMHHHHQYRAREPDDTDACYIQTDEGSNQVIIDQDSSFILDKAHDNVVAYHCSRALRLSQDNHILHWLNDLLIGERNEMETEFCSSRLVEGEGDPDTGHASFVDGYFVEADSIDHQPNEPQRRFIRETDKHLVVVQGPPGTGKTSYTTTPAILGRAYAFTQDGQSFTGAISALSHDAVDEIFENVVGVAEDCHDECFPRMKLIRVRPSSLPYGAESYDRRDDDQLVEHTAYQQDEGAERLRDLYEEYVLKNGAEGDNTEPSQFLLFGPPTSIRGAVDKIAPLYIDLDELDRESHYDPTAWELLQLGRGELFDLAVVDEASMMDLPQLFLAGAFLRSTGQVLLAGDHRQMQPIRTHGWKEETRETIEETVPFLSALDYIRFLKGDIEQMDFIERESPGLDDDLTNDEQEQAVLPMYPLETTFRLPGRVANLLTELFYKQDGITLDARDDREPIPHVDIPLNIIDELTDPEEWVSVLVHTGSRDERSSELEAAITEAVLDPSTL